MSRNLTAEPAANSVVPVPQREGGRPLALPLSPAAFMKPISLKRPPAWVGHIPFACWLVDMLRPRTVVELGTHSGNSYFAFCQAVKELGTGTSCYAVDTWRGDEHAGHYGEEVWFEVSRHNARHYEAFSRLIRSSFDEALDQFADGSIELLHIDGLHTYEGVRHDFETWRPKLSNDAVVLFHDTNVRERGFGVFKLWAELAEAFPSFEFLHSNGLGVLCVGSAPPPLADLFAAAKNADKRSQIRDMFSQLGQSVEAILVLEHEAAVRAEEQARLAEITQHYTLAMAQVSGLGAELQTAADKAKHADQLRATVDDLQHQHVLATQRADSLANELLSARDAHDLIRREIADLQRHYGLACAEKDGLRAEARAATEALAELRAKLDEEEKRNAEQRQAALQAANDLKVQITGGAGELSEWEGHGRKSDEASRQRRADSDLSLPVILADLKQLLARERQRRAELELSARNAAVFEARVHSSERRIAELEAELGEKVARQASLHWLVRQVGRVMMLRLGALGGQRLRSFAKQLAGADNEDIELIAASGLFDIKHYAAQAAGMPEDLRSGIRHFLRGGARRGLNPNEFFHTDWYLRNHADVSAQGVNPLIHYIRHGSAEGRSTSRTFDSGYYLSVHEDVRAAGIEPLLHYLRDGRFEGRAAVRGDGHSREGSSFFDLAGFHDVGDLGAEGTELLLSAAQAASSDHTTSDANVESLIDVVIPVFGGLDETRKCIASVLKWRGSNRRFGRLILVDDCGPIPELRKHIGDVAARDEGVDLIVNEANLGFVKSVNRAMRLSQRDVILLNADTQVHGNWVDRLARHGDGVGVASVTAFSNNATICTFPAIGGSPELYPGYDLAEIDQAFAAANPGIKIEIPTGVGFCMLLRRSALDALGLFDECFGKGYGEETDFCQKAIARGFVNVVAGDVFVYHHGSVSFGASAAEEQLTGGAIMRERYPDYEPSVRRWIEKDPALRARLNALATLVRKDRRRKLLHILHPWGGGTEKQVSEIISGVPELLHLVLITQSVEGSLHLGLMIPEEKKWRRFNFTLRNLRDLAPVIAKFGVSRVHVHHALEVMDSLPDFIGALKVPYDLSIHDYALVCPRNNLIGESGSYCGEPDDQGCLACLRRAPRPRALDIVWWRHKGAALMESAERVICPSLDVASRMRRYAPKANLIAAPHEADAYRPTRTARSRSVKRGEPLRVSMLGVLAEHKGAAFAFDCIEGSVREPGVIQWTLVGYFPAALRARADALSRVLRVTGAYESQAVLDLIDEVDPDLIFFPQHCVETYSYTLSEALLSGRTIVAPNIGAFTERLAGVEGCFLYDYRWSPQRVLNFIREVAADPSAAATIAADGTEEHGGVALETSFYQTSYKVLLVGEPKGLCAAPGDVVHSQETLGAAS